MRLLLLPLLACLAAVPAFAQQISPMTGTTAGTDAGTRQASPAPATSVPAATAPARARRMTAQERFDAANTTRDGKLTLAQAQAGHMRQVAQNFEAIDTARHGYVTMDDIRAYNRAQRQAHKAAKAAKPQ